MPEKLDAVVSRDIIRRVHDELDEVLDRVARYTVSGSPQCATEGEKMRDPLLAVRIDSELVEHLGGRGVKDAAVGAAVPLVPALFPVWLECRADYKPQIYNQLLYVK